MFSIHFLGLKSKFKIGYFVLFTNITLSGRYLQDQPDQILMPVKVLFKADKSEKVVIK